MANKARAKDVICEIVRQAGGTLTNKTNLFKAFYHSHLIYAEQNPGYLSDWPIVRMPNGPGIDRFDTLLGELMIEGRLHSETETAGNFQAFRFRLAEGDEPSLETAEVDAIAAGTDHVLDKTAAQASADSHRQSRSWREAKDGDELNIYIDSIPDEEYQENKKRMAPMVKHLNEMFGTDD